MTRRAAHRFRACSSALIAIALTSARVRSQSVDRSHPPVAPAQAFKFPNVRTMPTILPDGLPVYVVEDHSVPVVSVRVVTAADSTFDPPGKEGLYAVTLGAASEGTATLTAEQFAERAAEIGTRVTPAGFTTTPALFPRAIALLAEMLVRPKLDSEGVRRRKALQAAAARRVAQSTVTVPRHLFYAMLYGADDPYVRSLVPTQASVESITASDVAALHMTELRPDRMSIVIAGDVTGGEAIHAARRAFQGWAAGTGLPDQRTFRPLPVRTTTIYLYDAPGAQAYVYVGAAGPARASPDAYAADVMSAIALVRMQRTLRDKRSFMYSGAMGITWRRAARPSAFVGSTVVAADKVDSALVAWLSMLRSLRDGVAEPITPAELAAAQRLRLGSLAARMDGADSLSARLAEIRRDDLPFDYWDRYAEGVSALSVKDVAAAAAQVLDMEHLVIVVAGDRKVIEPALRAASIAPVVLVDANGNPLSP